MNIALDAHYIDTDCGGIETYIYNLIKNLLDIDDDNRYYLYTSPRLKKGAASFANDKVSTKRLLSDAGISRIFMDIPVKLLNDRPDIYHGQVFLPISLAPVKKVLTLHDVFFLENPSWATVKEKIKFGHVYYSAKKADHIITVSDFSKNEILKHLDLPEKKVSVIYSGVSDLFFKSPGSGLISKNIKHKYSLPENYILYAGRINIRKNILTLLKSFADLKRRRKETIKLVITGRMDGKNENISKIIAELNLNKDILLLGHIPYEDLPHVYSSAKLLIFIPFYEGFGLPPLEAMASGTPVIASDIPVFREILGDSALLVEPGNPDQVSSIMNDLLNDNNLMSDLTEKGLRRARLFTWRDCASKTMKIYNAL